MLRHIIKIEYFPASFQKWAVPLPCGTRLLLPEVIVGTRLPLASLAAVEVTDEVENGTRRYTTKLTATLRCPYAEVQEALTRRHLSLRLTAADGTQYIMGLACRPHPLIRVSATLTSTWTGIHPLLEVAE